MFLLMYLFKKAMKATTEAKISAYFKIKILFNSYKLVYFAIAPRVLQKILSTK